MSELKQFLSGHAADILDGIEQFVGSETPSTDKPRLDYVQSSVGSRYDPPAVDNTVMTHKELCHGDQSSTNAAGPVVV
jgi:hypothetical protein